MPQLGCHLAQQILIVDLLLHGAGHTAQVHQDQAGARLRGEPRHAGIEPQPRDVVHDLGARAERGLRHLVLRRVDGDRDAQPRRRSLHDGEDTPELLFGRQGL